MRGARSGAHSDRMKAISWKRLAVAAAQCSVPAPVQGNGALPDRAATIARMEQMPDACLKRMLFVCGEAANQRDDDALRSAVAFDRQPVMGCDHDVHRRPSITSFGI